ncbi:radical SAM protein [Desulfolutivibrio sulfoxidireducens]|uniref:radical SAM protein n=1 Tax=Desulfolutivibrio sulfoxidireducens TaxID=2773299 RepID=UPI00159E22BA|nr:radical SAM protein [Desulfolutivibrio sulfoxidireducens]QLA20606.1 radical SAM protein [Desulfolutivibrio sulfoxidireducens]
MIPERDASRHPCFNKAASGHCGRVHLPVAPKCNIRCNYCDRKHDCVNESRPGVSSAVLTPPQALAYMRQVLEREPRITVAGIAGPGDPMANWAETHHTLRLLKEHYPHLLFCLSTNGLALPDHVDELAEVGATHVTVTINAVDPAVGAEIYGWVRDGKLILRGRDAAALLIGRQLESVRRLKDRGITVKINTILIPGKNDHHIGQVAATVAALGADIHNIIPMFPTANTPFEDIPEPGKEQVEAARRASVVHLPQMTHCRRCRADAVGLLCSDLSGELSETLRACSRIVPGAGENRPYVAVASREGMLINLHLGEAWAFHIYGKNDEGVFLVEERAAPEPGGGPRRWEELARTLKDCRAILCSAYGETPAKILMDRGIMVHGCAGLVEDGVEEAFGTGGLTSLKSRRQGLSGACRCGGGSGEGCG